MLDDSYLVRLYEEEIRRLEDDVKECFLYSILGFCLGVLSLCAVVIKILLG